MGKLYNSQLDLKARVTQRAVFSVGNLHWYHWFRMAVSLLLSTCLFQQMRISINLVTKTCFKRQLTFRSAFYVVFYGYKYRSTEMIWVI